MKKNYTFVLNFGYVEHCSLSYFPFSSLNKYSTAREALVDLALFLKEKYLIKHKEEPKKCCISSKEKDPAAEFCSKCGSSLEEPEFDEEEFSDWLQQMSHCDIDSFHGDFIDWNDEDRWQTGNLEGAPNQRFVYQAEWVLLAALGYPPQDITFEDICKERTKSKRESFSYY